MNKLYHLLSISLATLGMVATGTALAGPPVAVTFKNLGTSAATYRIVTNNEASTYSNATPKPLSTVQAANSDIYTVTSTISPDANFANVRYAIGSKQCVFSTIFLNAIKPGGGKVPQWNKTATGSGGAICTATITSINFATYAWAVTFTMK